jgi:hypothetical protein
MSDSTEKIRLFFVRETPLARAYVKHNRPKMIQGFHETPPDDVVWIPRSIIEHTSKLNAANQNEHILTLPNWFIEKEGL